MKYLEGAKYQLWEREVIPVPELMGFDSFTGALIKFDGVAGTLTGKRFYAWDGASGTTIDTDNSMLESLAHDLCAEIARKSPDWDKKTRKRWEKAANKMFYRLLRTPGTAINPITGKVTPAMGRFRARYWLFFLSKAHSYVDPSERKKVHEV